MSLSRREALEQVNELMQTKDGRNQLFSDVERHPLMRRENEKKVITLFPVNVQKGVFAPYMPMVTADTDKIEMDVDLGIRGGLTPAVTRMQESPVHGSSGRAARSWDAQSFREKVQLFPHELVDLRVLGTRDTYETAQRMLARKNAVIERRLVNRMEWMRRQVVFDRAVTYTLEGTEISVPYAHPDFLRPDAGVAWSNVASADPIDDLSTWMKDFKEFAGMDVEEIILPDRTMQKLVKNERFLAIMKSSYSAFPNTESRLMGELSFHLGGVKIRESGDYISLMGRTTAAIAATGTALSVDDATMIETGDNIVVINPATDHRERFEVSSVTGTTITLGAGTVNAFPQGSSFHVAKKLIKENKVVILGRPEAGMFDPVGFNGLPDESMVETWGDVCSVRSYYNDLTGRPGIFRKNIDKLTNGDPGHIEQVIGVRALPRLHIPGFMVCDIEP